jgi:hypothetical protein
MTVLDAATFTAVVDAHTQGWSPAQKAALLTHIKVDTHRKSLAARYPTAGALAKSVDHTTIQTPALQCIDENIEWALSTPAGKLQISMPSQEGKSTRAAVWAVIRALQLNPDWRIIVASHSYDLAAEHVPKIRDIIRDHGSDAKDPLTGLPLPDKLGLALASDKSAAARFRIKGRRGGVVAAGVGSGLAGKPADMMVIDDPHPSMTAADSATERAKVWSWWDSVASQCLSPTAPLILIQTRWHEQDLAGLLLAQDTELPEEMQEWRSINFPAIAEHGIPDALARAPGERLVSARDTTVKLKDWARSKRTKAARVWAAMFQGVPTPAEGGLFSRAWFARHRVDAEDLPPLALRIVAVDPAETGQGDEAGIIAAGAGGDGKILLTHDRSARMTSDQWARAAVLLAVETSAFELACEGYNAATTYRSVLVRTWEDIQKEAATKPDRKVEGVEIPEGDRPFRIHMWRGQGDAGVRSGGLRYAVETGKTRVWGHHLKVLEIQASGWQQGQHQPDRVAAAVIAQDRLAAMVGAPSKIAVPGRGRQAGRGLYSRSITGR